MRRTTTLIALSLALALGGCASEPEPLRDSREALGTVVSLSLYVNAQGPLVDSGDVRDAGDAAYAEMDAVEAALDAHDPESAIAKINAAGGGELPTEAIEVLGAIETLKVGDQFSPYLLEVAKLYDFEGGGNIPDPETLDRKVDAQRGWTLEGTRIAFEPPAALAFPKPPSSGLDLGGAAKGLALDRAIESLRGPSVIEAALATAGSTTVTFGSKPDGGPWRIGIEDPRDPETTVATVEAPAGVTVSTSGDYQRYFERDGVRYHHILDPATGLPARGLRSLSVVGAATGLDSDILSTALFVMGADRATAYAREHGLGLVLVDDEGRVRIVPGPEDADWRIVSQD